MIDHIINYLLSTDPEVLIAAFSAGGATVALLVSSFKRLFKEKIGSQRWRYAAYQLSNALFSIGLPAAAYIVANDGTVGVGGFVYTVSPKIFVAAVFIHRFGTLLRDSKLMTKLLADKPVQAPANPTYSPPVADTIETQESELPRIQRFL